MNTHWIVYRQQQDPPGILFVSISHSAEEAKTALEDAARNEAARANVKREADFGKGYASVRKMNPGDFVHTYITAEVTRS